MPTASRIPLSPAIKQYSPGHWWDRLIGCQHRDTSSRCRKRADQTKETGYQLDEDSYLSAAGRSTGMHSGLAAVSLHRVLFRSVRYDSLLTDVLKAHELPPSERVLGTLEPLKFIPDIHTADTLTPHEFQRTYIWPKPSWRPFACNSTNSVNTAVGDRTYRKHLPLGMTNDRASWVTSFVIFDLILGFPSSADAYPLLNGGRWKMKSNLSPGLRTTHIRDFCFFYDALFAVRVLQTNRTCW